MSEEISKLHEAVALLYSIADTEFSGSEGGSREFMRWSAVRDGLRKGWPQLCADIDRKMAAANWKKISK